MKTKETLNIPLNNVQKIRVTGFEVLIQQIDTGKKSVFIDIVTYTMSYSGVMYLNKLAAKGIVIRAVYNQIDCMTSCMKFFNVHNEHLHSKIWNIGGRIFIGSTNMCADTIGNLMVEIKDKHQKEEIKAHIEWAFHKKLEPNTHFVL